MEKIILRITVPGAKKKRREYATLDRARQAAAEAVGERPIVRDGVAIGKDGTLLVSSVAFEELLPGAEVEAPAVEEDELKVLGSGKRWRVVREADGGLYCECGGFSASPTEPKVCRHLYGLIGKGVFTAEEEVAFEDAWGAPAPPLAKEPPRLDEVAAAFKALRSAKIAAIQNVGGLKDDQAKLVKEHVERANAFPKKYRAVLLELRRDRIADGAGSLALRLGVCAEHKLETEEIQREVSTVFVAAGFQPGAKFLPWTSVDDASLDHYVVAFRRVL